MNAYANFKQIKINHLLNIINGIYDRSSILFDNNITLFKFDQDYIHSICENELYVSEQKEYTKFLAKNELTSGKYIADEVKQKFEEIEYLSKDTGNYWDKMATHYLRRFHYLRLKENDKFNDLQNHYNIKIFEGIKLEYQRHQHGLHLNYDINKIDHRILLIKEIMQNYYFGYDIHFNCYVNNNNLLVYTGKYNDRWSLFMAIQLKGIVYPIEEKFHIKENEGYMYTLPIGPQLTMIFGWIVNKTKKISIDSPNCLPLKFEWFLPIRKTPLWSNYSYFYSLDQLEALVNIHCIFYKILLPEIYGER